MTSPSAQQPPPEQEQEYPAALPRWTPRPRDEMCGCEGRGLLAGERAGHRRRLGIGRAVAVAFAQEGADVAIAYLSEREPHAG
jgi:hypothetical protein